MCVCVCVWVGVCICALLNSDVFNALLYAEVNLTPHFVGAGTGGRELIVQATEYNALPLAIQYFYSFCRFRFDDDVSRSDKLLTISLGTNAKFNSLQRFTINCSKFAPDLKIIENEMFVNLTATTN